MVEHGLLVNAETPAVEPESAVDLALSLSLSLWSVSASEQPLLNRIMDRFLTYGYNLQNHFLRLQSGDEDEDDDD